MKPQTLYRTQPPVVRSFRDAAQLIGLSPAALAGAIRRKEIPLEILTYGRRRFVRSADLAAFLQQQNRTTT